MFFALSVCLLQMAFVSRNSLFYVGGHSDLVEYQIEDPSSYRFCFCLAAPSFFVIYLFLCLCVTLHCHPTDDDNKWGLICLVCCNIFLTHLFLAFGWALLSLFAASKSEGLHQPGGKLRLGRYSSSSCGFSLGLWQGM